MKSLKLTVKNKKCKWILWSILTQKYRIASTNETGFKHHFYRLILLASWWLIKTLKVSLTKWLSVRLRTKWLWIRILWLFFNPWHAPGLSLYQPTPLPPIPSPKKREKLWFSDFLMGNWKRQRKRNGLRPKQYSFTDNSVRSTYAIF